MTFTSTQSSKASRRGKRRAHRPRRVTMRRRASSRVSAPHTPTTCPSARMNRTRSRCLPLCRRLSPPPPPLDPAPLRPSYWRRRTLTRRFTPPPPSSSPRRRISWMRRHSRRMRTDTVPAPERTVRTRSLPGSVAVFSGGSRARRPSDPRRVRGRWPCSAGGGTTSGSRDGSRRRL